MNAKKTRTAKAGKTAKKSKTQQVSRGAYVKIRLLAAAALVLCAVMAIVVDAADPQSTPTMASASKPSAETSYVSTSIAAVAKATTPDSTYVGCLRAEDDGKKFVLTEVGGPDAPRSRNWKTMFVTKKSGKLEVTPVGTLKLRSHVDQTVQVTGKRSEKAFSARSVKVVGSTCT
ncbi:MAG: hypothetical protein ACRD09_03960 [Vicinamibacterales bacterium]